MSRQPFQSVWGEAGGVAAFPWCSQSSALLQTTPAEHYGPVGKLQLSSGEQHYSQPSQNFDLRCLSALEELDSQCA